MSTANTTDQGMPLVPDDLWLNSSDFTYPVALGVRACSHQQLTKFYTSRWFADDHSTLAWHSCADEGASKLEELTNQVAGS